MEDLLALCSLCIRCHNYTKLNDDKDLMSAQTRKVERLYDRSKTTDTECNNDDQPATSESKGAIEAAIPRSLKPILTKPTTSSNLLQILKDKKNTVTFLIKSKIRSPKQPVSCSSSSSSSSSAFSSLTDTDQENQVQKINTVGLNDAGQTGGIFPSSVLPFTSFTDKFCIDQHANSKLKTQNRYKSIPTDLLPIINDFGDFKAREIIVAAFIDLKQVLNNNNMFNRETKLITKTTCNIPTQTSECMFDTRTEVQKEVKKTKNLPVAQPQRHKSNIHDVSVGKRLTKHPDKVMKSQKNRKFEPRELKHLLKEDNLDRRYSSSSSSDSSYIDEKDIGVSVYKETIRGNYYISRKLYDSSQKALTYLEDAFFVQKTLLRDQTHTNCTPKRLPCAVTLEHASEHKEVILPAPKHKNNQPSALESMPKSSQLNGALNATPGSSKVIPGKKLINKADIRSVKNNIKPQPDPKEKQKNKFKIWKRIKKVFKGPRRANTDHINELEREIHDIQDILHDLVVYDVNEQVKRVNSDECNTNICPTAAAIISNHDTDSDSAKGNTKVEKRLDAPTKNVDYESHQKSRLERRQSYIPGSSSFRRKSLFEQAVETHATEVEDFDQFEAMKNVKLNKIKRTGSLSIDLLAGNDDNVGGDDSKTLNDK